MSLLAVDHRARELYFAAGHSPRYPPSPVRLARALLGRDAVTVSGHEEAPRPPICVAVGGRWEIRLHESAGDAANCFAIYKGLAQWDAARGGPVTRIEVMALALALPIEAYAALVARGCDVKEIARVMTLSTDVVRMRAPLAKCRRLRVVRTPGGSAR